KKIQDTVECLFIGHGTSNDIKGIDYKNKAVAMLCENLSSGIEAYRNLPGFKSIAYVNLIFKNGFGEYRMGKYHMNDANNYYKIYSAFNFLTLETFNAEYLHERQEVIHSLDSLFGNDHDYSAFFVGNRFCQMAYNKTWKDLNKLSLMNEKTEENLLLEIPTITALAKVDFTKSKLIEYPTENILGYVPGTDLKNEVIVVTAHYDHVGTDKLESSEAIYAENDTICYGADDNATGTAAVIEMAKAFMKAKEAGYENRRSIIFAALSAEEKGLRGAFHYVNNPPFALDSTVLNVNLDMIGRDSKNKEKNSNSVFILSLGQKKGLLKSTPKKENKKLNRRLKVDGTPGLKERLTWKFSSDHYHFKKQGIPALIFFTGLHPDYHTPADTPDKINYDKLTRITQLSFLSVWNLANSDKITVPDRSKLKTKENLIDKVMK
ncbi:MAG: M28 family peptidase, partial [Bacteroidales bacterium]|nr:M28 family peptidase [Bacteroidales bacterium]